MGNSALCGGAPQRCVEECTRLHGEARSRDLEEEQECDPAGAVFSETLRGLPSLDQEALRFAGSPNLAAVRWLLALGANPKVRDSSGTTLLHAACRSGSCLIVQELVKQGLPLDAQDNSGWTPLHITAVMGRRDLALLLVRVRANISVRNKKGALPVSMCTDPGTMEVLEEFCTGSGLARPHPKPFLADMLVMNPGMNHDDYSASCEPFFVPRPPICLTEGQGDQVIHIGHDMFRQSGGHGLAFCVATGVVHDHPTDLSQFVMRQRFHPGQLGEFLGEDFSLAQTLRLAYIHSVDVTGTGVVGALMKAFEHMHAPRDLSKVDRLTSAVASLWWRTHDGDWAEKSGMPEDGSDLDWTMFAEVGGPADATPRDVEEVTGIRLRQHVHSVEGLRRLMFSTMMLVWNFHGAPRNAGSPRAESGMAPKPAPASAPAAPGRLTFASWLDMNLGIEVDGSNMPVYLQKGIYQTVARHSRAHTLLPSSSRIDAEARERPDLAGGGASSSSSGPPSAALAGASSALDVEDVSLLVKGRATIPRGGLERHESGATGPVPRLAECIMSENLGMSLTLGMPNAAQAATEGEAVFLNLRFNLFLFLSSDSAEDSPYAFIKLQDCVLREVGKHNRSLILAGRPRDAVVRKEGAPLVIRQPAPLGDGNRMPLRLCFLLADGRFQLFEAAWLELQFATDEELETWARELDVACNKPQEAAKQLMGPRTSAGERPSVVRPPSGTGSLCASVEASARSSARAASTPGTARIGGQSCAQQGASTPCQDEGPFEDLAVQSNGQPGVPQGSSPSCAPAG